MPTDVTDPESVRHLADEAYAAFGAVHVLCNNAGVGPPSAKVWNTTPNDWRWTFGVNVFGAANGVIEFVPRMIEDDRYCADELQQIKAAVAALRQVAVLIVEQHVAAASVYASKTGTREVANADMMRVLREALKL